MFPLGQSNFLQALGWAVLNSLWQMALLWVVYQLITAIFRTTKSSQKSLLATTLLLTGFAWFVFTFFVTLADASSAHAGYSAFIPASGHQEVNEWLYTMLPIGSVVYLVLLIFPLLNFSRNYRYVQVIRRYGLTKADVKWRMFVQKVAAQMGITKPVHIWMSEFVTSPVTVGYLKPVILLPVAAVNHLSFQQIEAILLHELSHIRRSDFLINLVTRVIQTLLYFNPFVKAFAKIIETERERDCDEMVLQFQYEPHGYASALLTLEKAAQASHSLAVAAAGGKNDLLTRVESILGIRKKQSFSFNKLAGVVAALFCFISLNALLLLSKPGETTIKPGLLTDLSVPFHLFTPAREIKDIPSDTDPVAEFASTSIINTPQQSPKENKGNTVKHNSKPAGAGTMENEAPAFAVTEPLDKLPLMYVNFTEEVIPELAPEQEQQVEQALKASKKVMTEDQWKAVEKSIADAMTSAEKDKLKQEYSKAMSKIDWKKMEEKLKVAYNEINWNQINTQLNKALVEIRLDSLQHVYSATMADLSSIEKELKQSGQCGVPDSDVTLKSLSQQKKEVQKAINIIKSVRNRKVVHL